MKFIEWLLGRRVLLTLLLVAILPFSLRGAFKCLASNSNNVADWMPSDFSSIQELERFVELFGAAELLMVSWPGCTLDDERIAAYEQQLLEPGQDGEPYFRDVLTGAEIHELFTSDASRIPVEEVPSRMSGWILSPDGETTGLLCFVSAAGAADRHAAIRHVYDATERVEGLHADDLRVAGPTFEGVAIDKASTTNLLALNLGSFAVCLVIMLACLRNLRASIVLLLMALFNEQLALAIIYYAGTNLDSVLMLSANLAFVITISIGVHLFNYYKDAVQTETPANAPAHALMAAWRPTLLATLTTALGLLSLTVSDIRPLMRFGFFSTASIVIGAAFTLVYVSLHFRIWPLRPASAANNRIDRGRRNEPRGSSLGLFVAIGKGKWAIIVLALLMLVIGGLGTRKLKTSVGLNQLLSSETRAIKDYRWLEDEIGSLVPVEIVIAMPAGNARTTLAQFRFIEGLHKQVQELDASAPVISATTFAPQTPRPGGGIRQRTAVAAFQTDLIANQQGLANLGYLHVQDDLNYWRITVRAPALKEVDYGELLRELRAVVESALAEHEQIETREVLISGGVAVVYQVQEQLLDDLIKSFSTAFGLVCVTLMVLFRSIPCGLICMIPNLLPSAVVFGCMGWMGTRIEVGTVLTASAALGIAVDDSMHFITWFRRELLDGGTVRQAVRYAYRRCSAAMLQTTLVCTLGLLVFALSPFAPMQRFAWCMFALLGIALIADLVVLPAILLSPFGRPFMPKATRIRTSDTEQRTQEAKTDQGLSETQESES